MIIGDINNGSRLTAEAEFMQSVSLLTDSSVQLVREKLEGTVYGEPAKRGALNRRPYAVLEPSRDENLQRIQNVMSIMPKDTLDRLGDIIKGALKEFYHYEKDS